MNLLADHETSAPDEWLLERMRLRRDALLVESDWAMIADTPTDKTAWALVVSQLATGLGVLLTRSSTRSCSFKELSPLELLQRSLELSLSLCQIQEL